MFSWATSTFETLSNTLAPPPTDAVGRFHYSCQNGDEPGAIQAASQLQSPNCIVNQVRGTTPLHVACQFGMPRLLTTLVETGASLYAVDSAGNTPLHAACTCASTTATTLDIVKLLVKHYNCSVTVKNQALQTPYDVAVLDSVRQYLLPLQLQQETLCAINAGEPLPAGSDMGGMHWNQPLTPPPIINVFETPTPTSKTTVAPPYSPNGHYGVQQQQQHTPQAYRQPQEQQHQTPTFTALSNAIPTAPQSAPVASTTDYARRGYSSAAVGNSKYQPDGFHSSSSDKRLQEKYGHGPAAVHGSVLPPPVSGNPTTVIGANPYAGATSLSALRPVVDPRTGRPAAQAPPPPRPAYTMWNSSTNTSSSANHTAYTNGAGPTGQQFPPHVFHPNGQPTHQQQQVFNPMAPPYSASKQQAAPTSASTMGHVPFAASQQAAPASGNALFAPPQALFTMAPPTSGNATALFAAPVQTVVGSAAASHYPSAPVSGVTPTTSLQVVGTAGTSLSAPPILTAPPQSQATFTAAPSSGNAAELFAAPAKIVVSSATASHFHTLPATDSLQAVETTLSTPPILSAPPQASFTAASPTSGNAAEIFAAPPAKIVATSATAPQSHSPSATLPVTEITTSLQAVVTADTTLSTAPQASLTAAPTSGNASQVFAAPMPTATLETISVAVTPVPVAFSLRSLSGQSAASVFSTKSFDSADIPLVARIPRTTKAVQSGAQLPSLVLSSSPVTNSLPANESEVIQGLDEAPLSPKEVNVNTAGAQQEPVESIMASTRDPDELDDVPLSPESARKTVDSNVDIVASIGMPPPPFFSNKSNY
jgi:hypothetical protein